MLGMKMMNNIKDTRLAAGLTQKQVSELLEIPIKTLQKWEQGERNPAPWAEKLIIEKLESLK